MWFLKIILYIFHLKKVEENTIKINKNKKFITVNIIIKIINKYKNYYNIL